MEEPRITDHSIIECLRIHYGIEVSELTLLPIGADVNAAVYKARGQDSFYFVKLKRGHQHDNSTIIMDLLQKAGIKEIIPPIKTVGGKSTQAVEDFTMIVSPFIDGQDGFSQPLTDDQWRTLSKVMKQVHEIKVPQSIQNKVRHENYSPKWRQIVRSFYDLIEAGPSGDEAAMNLLKFMKVHLPEIKRLVDRAEQLGRKIQDLSPELVLCHSDIHGGNVLIDRNENIYIVDWDDPIMAPKERDLMFIGGGVANVWNKPHEEELFYTGYGQVEVQKEILAYYRFERIVEDIADFGQQLLLTSEGGEDRLQSYQHFVGQFEPNGVVGIAFKTDEKLAFDPRHLIC
jgi:spectinomycin phosphotransferase